jgi:hypothetical protein
MAESNIDRATVTASMTACKDDLRFFSDSHILSRQEVAALENQG